MYLGLDHCRHGCNLYGGSGSAMKKSGVYLRNKCGFIFKELTLSVLLCVTNADSQSVDIFLNSASDHHCTELQGFRLIVPDTESLESLPPMVSKEKTKS
jgi:hypothetical protein